MNNINYSLPLPKWGVQILPLDQTAQLGEVESLTDDETINHNFAILYQKLEEAKKDLTFLDFMKVVDVATTQSEATNAVLDRLLPGEAIAINTTSSITILGEEYYGGDYILRMPDQSFQHIYGFTPLGFLPRYDANNNNLQLFYYETGDLSPLYTKIEVNYSSNTIKGYTENDTVDLTWGTGSDYGYFIDNNNERIKELVPEYSYIYNSTSSEGRYASIELTFDNNFSGEITVGESSTTGIVKLYKIKLSSENNYIIEEIYNGLNINYNSANGKLTVSLVNNLKAYATTNRTNIRWWVEVK